MDFRKVSVSDKPEIDKFFAEADYGSSNYNFCTVYMWDDYYPHEFTITDGFLVFRHRGDMGTIYSMPIGNGDLDGCLHRLADDEKKAGQPLTILGATSEAADKLSEMYGDRVHVSAKRAMADYVYSAEKLALLTGKKLHSKRGFINKFTSVNNWSFIPVTSENLVRCRAMTDRWFEENMTKKGESSYYERLAMDRAYNDFEALDLEGAMITVGDEVVAIEIGQRLNSDTYLIHFEKAFSYIPGAYQIINREYAAYVCRKYPDIAYINREEDMGLEGLRKSKLSYYPEKLLFKHKIDFDRAF